MKKNLQQMVALFKMMRRTLVRRKKLNMKHTPGPWIFSKHWICRSDEAKNKAPEAPAQIAYVGYGHNKEGELSEEQLANAKLIAAAPELLEALLVLKEWVGKLQDWAGEDPPCEIVDEALNKASTV